MVKFQTFLIAFLTGAILLSSNAAQSAPPVQKSLFISVLQDPPVLSDRVAIEALVTRAKHDGYHTLFMQVYRANEAWFPSKNARNTSYERCLKSVGEDPLALLIRLAHAEGIEVHAWLNLLSLSADAKAPILEKYGPSVLTRNTNAKKKMDDYRVDRQFFLEPGDARVVQILSDIVGELVTAYPALDGIQFDYIRYPDVMPSYGHTESNLEAFRQATGKSFPDEQDPDWRKWKRDRVTALVKKLRDTARALHPGIQVSTTGLMPYVRAREEAFQDWKEWASTGLVDFVTLMGYTDDMKQFEKYLKDAQTQLPGLEKANVAVAAYKLTERPELYGREWDLCEASSPRSCVALDYASLLQFKNVH